MGEDDHGRGCKELNAEASRLVPGKEGGLGGLASHVVAIKSKHAVNTYLRAVPMTDLHDLWHASRALCRRPE